MTSPEAQDSRSARQILADQLKQWGLEELSPDVDRLIREGLDAPAITISLADTEAYKRRFAANEQRRAKGLPVLSPAEYIAAESSYQTVLRSYGLPASFYDSRDDFASFIGNDVSPDELNDRAQIAQQTWLSTDSGTRSVWNKFYGLSDGAAIASILDPDRALPVVQRMANAARAGSAAERNGLVADKTRLEQYSDLGISAQDMEQAFSKIGSEKPGLDASAQRFGIEFTQADAEKATLLGDAAASRTRNRIIQNEQALFQGRASADEGALSRTRSGRF